MYESKTFGKITDGRLNELSGPQLADLYNELVSATGNGDPIKKFSDRTTGIKRVKVELEAIKQQQKSKTELAEKSGKTKTKVPKEEGPLMLAADDEIRNHRPGTKRGEVIAAIKDGATMDELKKILDADESGVRIQLRQINRYVGLGIEERKDGKIYSVGHSHGRKPFEYSPAKDIKAHREGTKRAKVLDRLLNEGATLEEVQSLTGWNATQAFEGVKLLHTYLGYGLREDDKGVITAYAS